MKKIFLTCLLVCTMVLILCTTAFASDFNVKLPDNPNSSKYDSYVVIDMPRFSKYYCVYYDSDTLSPVYYKDYWISSLSDGYFILFMAHNGEGSVSTYEYSTYSYSNSNPSWSSFTSASSSFGSISSSSIASNCPIKDFNSFSILDGTESIYDDSGNEVFQWTPPLTMAQKVIMSVEEALANLRITVGGVMKILVLCGVGCLALLMGLKLFGKVLPTFLR